MEEGCSSGCVVYDGGIAHELYCLDGGADLTAITKDGIDVAQSLFRQLSVTGADKGERPTLQLIEKIRRYSKITPL